MIAEDGTFSGTDLWDLVLGKANPVSRELIASGISRDGCGRVTSTGTFENDTITGQFRYSHGGEGTFFGKKKPH